ncbi:MAG: mechanosensitive ion channel family protein [Clostridia bacterium]|nr:mechanosensitive ion channel family protein [Clostridia bacterium]
MKNIDKKVIIRFIVCIAALVILIPLGFITKLFNFAALGNNISITFEKIAKIVVMALAVIAIETLLVVLLKLPDPKNHHAKTLLSITSSLLKYVAFIVIVCWALSIIGVNVSTIFASVGILALVVGFSAESLIADVVTGAFMLFENQYNVGDIVEVDGFRGTVSEIGIRTTCITDLGGNIKIINNSSMKNILNRSDNASRSVSDIGIPYETDIEKLEKEIPRLMQEIYEKHPDLMKAPPLYLGVNELGESSVVLRFVVDVDESNIYLGARTLNHDLWVAFRSVGVEVPFPQIDVHNK